MPAFGDADILEQPNRIADNGNVNVFSPEIVEQLPVIRGDQLRMRGHNSSAATPPAG